MRTTFKLGCCVLTGLLALLLLVPRAEGQQSILHFGFESKGPQWKQSRSDAQFTVVEHALTEQHAHEGKSSEVIRLEVTKGALIHYTFDLPMAPITEDLQIRLWLKANRPNVQLLCRIVFPRERDPQNPALPLTSLVRCEAYKSSIWRPISLPQPMKRLREERTLLASSLKRDIDTSGAYIDQLVLNVCDGVGLTEVWIDDLEVGPVLSRPIANTGPIALPVSPNGSAPPPRMPKTFGDVQISNGDLKVGGKNYLMRGIRNVGTPLTDLVMAGCNTLFVDEDVSQAVIDKASERGLLLVPRLAATPGANRSSRELSGRMSKFLTHEGVLAWDVGRNLDFEQALDTSRLAQAVRSTDPQRPVLLDSWDGLPGFARSIDQGLLGTHRWPLNTSLELPAYRDWLAMRARLVPGAYLWTWVQAHIDDWLLAQAFRSDGKGGYHEPLGPHPEQIRLLTWCALSAGYRGVAYWPDRFFANPQLARDRLFALALLNQELRLLEPILTQAGGTPEWIKTSRPEVMAAVFRAPPNMLVVPLWVGPGTQYVPGQAASPELSVTVSAVPITASATVWEVSPGRIRSYLLHRDAGGTTVRLRNFSLATALVFTSDYSREGVVVQLQERQRELGRFAAQWLHDQAQEELQKVERVQSELVRVGRCAPDSEILLKRCRQALDRCQRHRGTGEHGEGYEQAEVALRSLRLLMRGDWDRAVRHLTHPVSSPYAVSYFTLPSHWRMMDELAGLKEGTNVLPDGDFESEGGAGWYQVPVNSLDRVNVQCRKVELGAYRGKKCLQLSITPTTTPPPAVLERTYATANSARVTLPPGTLVRISAWYNVPKTLTGSADGALIFDNSGGDALAVRLREPTRGWHKAILYRRVPPSGSIQVTLMLSGVGTVLFDDVAIEPMVPASLTRRD